MSVVTEIIGNRSGGRDIGIYPNPHPINPFLVAHVTLNLNGDIKIGPTAIPVIWPDSSKTPN